MNCVSLKQCLAVTGGVVAVLCATPAIAAQTWNLTNITNTINGNGCVMNGGTATTSSGNYVSCNGTTTAELRGWGTTALNNAGSTYDVAALTNQGTSGLGMTSKQGVGFETTTSPDHAVDSLNNAELISFKFSQSVKLETVNFGWTDTDADFALLAWTGGGAPTLGTTIGGKTASGLIAAGWTLVGKYGDNDSTPSGNNNPASYTVNAGAVSSSYWLIGAFTTTLGGAGMAMDNLADAWKLLSVVATPSPPGGGGQGIPEPGSLVLAGAALLAAFGVRRRPGSSAQ